MFVVVDVVTILPIIFLVGLTLTLYFTTNEVANTYTFTYDN